MTANEDFFKLDSALSGVKGLVFLGEMILVYRRDEKTSFLPHAVDLPGGGAEPGETPFQVFARELREEFSLTVNEADVIYAKQYPSRLEPGKTAWFIAVQLDTDLYETIVFGDEGEEYWLMSITDYLELDDTWDVLQERTSYFIKNL